MHIKNYFQSLFISIVFVSSSMYGQAVRQTESNTMIRFTENKNQWDSRVLYMAQLDGGALFLEKNCFTYNFYDRDALRKNHAGASGKNQLKTTLKGHAFRMTFLNALSTVKISSKSPTSDYCNYFIGKDKKRWAGNVKNYKEVYYSSLYRGINLQILGKQNSLKYNFFVSPKANASDIQLAYDGLEAVSIENGVLKLKTNVNEITEHKPYSYQWVNGKKTEIPCEFVLENKTVHFNFPNGYNKELELIIDPELIFACSSGSLADNFGMTATYDAEGNLYSGGTCFNIGFPTTLGAYDTTYNGIVTYGRTDVVITKYDSTGTFLRYSTYLGGATSTEIVTSLIVDSQNNLLLYGATGSTDFPITKGAFDSTFNGGIKLRFEYNGTYFDNGTDIYVSKLNPTGSTLLASTYIGGSMNDGVNVNNDSVLIPAIGTYEFPADSLQYNYGDQYRGEINVDASGNIYINSSTRSTNFPTMPAGALDKTLGGKQDAIVFKLSPDLKTLIWSTYLGGSDNDAGNSLTLDSDNNVYVTGGTRSKDFPTTIGALQQTYKAGKADGFVAKINKDGTVLLNSTFWGTDKYDQCYFIQLDQNKNVYVVGQTEGKMPVTAGVYNNPNSSQFITKMDSALTKVIFSTVFGNGESRPNISPSAFLVDYCENVYVSGWGGDILKQTPISNMPITTDAIQKTTTGFDFYLIVLSRDATDLLYGTYFGGRQSEEHVDGGTSRFDKKGVVYQSVCAGCGGNDDFPVYPSNAWPNTGTDVNHNSNCNNGTFKLNFKVPGPLTNFTYEHKDSCAPLVVQFKNESPLPKYLWDFGNNDTTSRIKNPVKTYTVPGTYKVKLYVFNALNCYTWDTVEKDVKVYEPIIAAFDYKAIPCTREITFSDSSKVPVSWNWNFGDGSTSSVQHPPKHIFGTKTDYDVTLIVKNKHGCSDTITHEIVFADSIVSVNPDHTICLGTSADLLAAGGYEYLWSPALALNNVNIPNPTANPTVTTTYNVKINYINSLGDSCSTDLSTTVNVIDPNSIVLNATVDKDTVLKGESTALHVITNPGFTIQWIPTTGVKNPNAFDTPVTPSQTTTYTVSVTGLSGCLKSDTVTIYVISNECNDESVFVPNTFTPNEDGENDILFARSNNLTSAYFAVYNRWGELMFETTDLKKGWDGVYKGMKADPAVFAWYVKGKCYNGREFFKKGNVTLIR